MMGPMMSRSPNVFTCRPFAWGVLRAPAILARRTRGRGPLWRGVRAACPGEAPASPVRARLRPLEQPPAASRLPPPRAPGQAPPGQAPPASPVPPARTGAARRVRPARVAAFWSLCMLRPCRLRAAVKRVSCPRGPAARLCARALPGAALRPGARVPVRRRRCRATSRRPAPPPVPHSGGPVGHPC